MKAALKARLEALIGEDKTDQNPGFVAWQSWPQGWQRFQAWKRRHYARSREKRAIRKQLKGLES